MKANNQRRQNISAHQFDRVAMIISAQWDEVMSTVQRRANSHNQERHILIYQAIQSSALRQRVA